ncbi:Tim44 domain-containing protein [Ferribacterium limneticum]|uniref:Tim44 domain-containing protein n=1 Tax=Ferribacterium limneticum TaxID=76259 RepID=UPI001CFB0AD4|nr:TIM44-like domain-containing protein [Ferribacterium limneticum]UCV28357.1 Tim44 domain-containing protein [Ferribacterium limneticum]UCV32274.1 Tim44 domain-containing protein [Ferribacterium limneticum]
MKNFVMMAAALVLGFTLQINDAEAKRLGGGSSAGMQRQSVAPSKSTTAAPAQQQNAAPAAAPQAQPKRSWMGPLAGLAAGLGLAALASHFGFGEGLANFMMMALLAMVVIGVIGYFMRKKAAAAQQGGMQYAGAGANYGANAPREPDFIPAGGSAAAPIANATTSGNIPADFDVEGFVRNAKVNFIRLQASNDAGNLDDIREFTSPEMFAEIKMGMAERGNAKQETDVVQLNGEVLDVATETSRYVVSIRFTGLIREEKDAPAAPFDEIWHMTKPTDNSRGWVLAGIQQVQ